MRSSTKDHSAIDARFARFSMKAGRSPIQGTGVFALEPIPRGKLVIEYTGEVLNERQARRRLFKLSRKRGKVRNCIFHARADRYIDGGVRGSGAELINHSCDPNLKSRKRLGRVFYYSRRRVGAGEELTVDYNFRRDARLVRCLCGAKRCRGTINRK